MPDGLPGWVDDAACAGADHRLFVHDHTADPRTRDCRRCDQAKRICDTCQVRHQCLQHALERRTPGSQAGVYGGLDATQRRRLLEARRRTRRRYATR